MLRFRPRRAVVVTSSCHTDAGLHIRIVAGELTTIVPPIRYGRRRADPPRRLCAQQVKRLTMQIVANAAGGLLRRASHGTLAQGRSQRERGRRFAGAPSGPFVTSGGSSPGRRRCTKWSTCSSSSPRRSVTVTLVGETGIGQGCPGPRPPSAQRPLERAHWVVFDQGSVAANLAESELLGHERGAFTGALTSYAGAFERADGGTLFLDEIAELPLDLQSRLLRALDSRRVRRVGGSSDRRVDVRVVAATNRDLRAEVAAGRFRADLFFRLAVAVVKVPPLRRSARGPAPSWCTASSPTLGGPTCASRTPRSLRFGPTRGRATRGS